VQHKNSYLGAFAKLRKATVQFVMSVWSVNSHGTTLLPQYGFSWNVTFGAFRKSAERIQVSFKSDNWNGYFTRRPTYIYGNILL